MDGMELTISSLAYVISIEKMYGMQEILVVRLVHIEKFDSDAMSEYSWNPEGRPQEGSTQFTAETIYLVQKADRNFCRVTEYEILHTEARTLLFMHSYGYIRSISDFGNIRRFLEDGENRRVNYLSVLSQDQQVGLNANIQLPALKQNFKDLKQLLHRHFFKVRVRTIYQLINPPDHPPHDDGAHHAQEELEARILESPRS